MDTLEQKSPKMVPYALEKVDHRKREMRQTLKDKYTKKYTIKKDRFGAPNLSFNM